MTSTLTWCTEPITRGAPQPHGWGHSHASTATLAIIERNGAKAAGVPAIVGAVTRAAAPPAVEAFLRRFVQWLTATAPASSAPAPPLYQPQGDAHRRDA